MPFAFDAMLDVNINRFKEGARVLEDIARFVLRDLTLFSSIKALKQQVHSAPYQRSQLKDIGGVGFKENNLRNSLIALINANSRRMQEAARVLEEIGDSDFFKEIRFAAYAIHHEILHKATLYLKLEKLNGIYAICSPEKYPLNEMIDVINHSSITLCQLRMKSQTKIEIAKTISLMRKQMKEACLLIVNDHIDIALNEADGVHLGQADLPLEIARKISPPHFIIGITCHSTEQAKEAVAKGANYISVGCLYPTQTKNDTTSVSLETLQSIMNEVDIPVCAIGGINKNNIDEVIKTKVNMIAVCSALWEGKELESYL